MKKVEVDLRDIEEVYQMVEDLTSGTASSYELERMLQALLVTPLYVS